MKKIMSLLLSLILLLSLPINSFAMQASKTQIVSGIKIITLKDNNEVKVVQTEDATNIYEVTYDKISKSTQVSITNKQTHIKEQGEKISSADVSDKYNKMKMNVDATNQAQLNLQNKNSVSIMGAAPAVTSENTFCNFEYTKNRYPSYADWELRRPGEGFNDILYFNVRQTPANEKKLEAYKGKVEEINVLEWKYIGAVGMTGLTGFIAGSASAGAVLTGGTLTPAAWGAIAAATTSSGTAIALGIYLGEAMEGAYELYYEVKYS